MQGTIVPSPAMLQHLRDALVGVGDYTDSPCTVSLVEGVFDPADPTAWPAPSAHFAGLDSDAAPVLMFDGASQKWYVQWPDPAGGWVFTAGTITTSITITGYIVENTTFKLGATTISPVTITANGDTISLPEVTMEVSDTLVVPASQPQPV